MCRHWLYFLCTPIYLLLRFYLSRKALVGTVGEEEFDDIVVVLLGGHVKGCEAILALNVDGGIVVHQYFHHLLLAGCEFQSSQL